MSTDETQPNQGEGSSAERRKRAAPRKRHIDRAMEAEKASHPWFLRALVLAFVYCLLNGGTPGQCCGDLRARAAGFLFGAPAGAAPAPTTTATPGP